MALADYPTLKSKMDYPTQKFGVVKQFVTVGPSLGSYVHTLWRATGTPAQGGVPAASAVCDRATVGALGQGNPSSGDLRAWFQRLTVNYLTGSSSGCGVQLVDRLVHMGGLDGTNTGAQTVSTSALTRYTTGAGVMAAVEIYTAVGSTPQTFTCSYTDDAGNAGQTSLPVEIGNTGRSAALRLLPMSLAAGDIGVRAVSTLTLSGSTGTAGNFGVTLYKPLSPIIPLQSGVSGAAHPIFDMGGFVPLINTDACLTWLLYCSGSLTAVTAMSADFLES